MEEGGQYQRLLIAIVVFVAELGAFCLLGALSVGVILAQVLLLLLLAFAPVALVAAVIPGRGHDFFKGWLQKLAGYLLRKAAYSLILAILLAVCAALSAATSELGWLMSFGLQALFFWAVFLQRKTLTESLIGIATGPGAPGRDGALRVLALYYGARTARPARCARSGARPALGGAGVCGGRSRRRRSGSRCASGRPRPPRRRRRPSRRRRPQADRVGLSAFDRDARSRAAAAARRSRAPRPGREGRGRVSPETSAERTTSPIRTAPPRVEAEVAPPPGTAGAAAPRATTRVPRVR